VPTSALLAANSALFISDAFFEATPWNFSTCAGTVIQ
jgi:hypothetical protein